MDFELNIVYLGVDELTPYEKNTRKHSKKDLNVIKESIQEVGFNDPIGIWGDNNLIVEGHGRLIAAKELGMKTVPCIRLDHMTDEQRRAYAIIHNKSAELSEWDMELLPEELKGIQSIDMELFGFTENEVNKEIVEDEFDGSLPEEPVTKPGDIYQLGDHRLMCGDATDLEAVKNLVKSGFSEIGGGVIDLCCTDPPYGVDITGGTKDKLKIANDDLKEDDLTVLLTGAFKAMDAVMRPGAGFYIWHADGKSGAFKTACAAAEWEIRQVLIWAKNQLVIGRQDYQWRHEPCLYGWKAGAAHYFVDDRKQTTVLESDIPDIEKMCKQELLDLLMEVYDDRIATTIIREDKPKRNKDHPTMKPVKLIARLIKNSTKKGDSVIDLFGGSGTTLIACEQTGRRCFMSELDPRYCDVIVRRWEELTGKKAVKLTP